MINPLPPLALSVRQPWAWAIVAGHKRIENRSLGAIRAGRMEPGWICLHAASAMTEKEYRWGAWRLQKHGVPAPLPTDLTRRAIIGVVEVTGVISESDSEWFGGDHGLTLANARIIPPIPAAGALGYFDWTEGGAVPEPLPWMRKYSAPSLFDDLPQSFAEPPEKPFGTRCKDPR